MEGVGETDLLGGERDDAGEDAGEGDGGAAEGKVSGRLGPKGEGERMLSKKLAKSLLTAS